MYRDWDGFGIYRLFVTFTTTGYIVDLFVFLFFGFQFCFKIKTEYNSFPGVKNNGNEEEFYILQSNRTGALPSEDAYCHIQDTRWEVGCNPSTEMMPPYSDSPVVRAEGKYIRSSMINTIFDI